MQQINAHTDAHSKPSLLKADTHTTYLFPKRVALGNNPLIVGGYSLTQSFTALVKQQVNTCRQRTVHYGMQAGG